MIKGNHAQGDGFEWELNIIEIINKQLAVHISIIDV